jgi:hypothetical protein
MGGEGIGRRRFGDVGGRRGRLGRLGGLVGFGGRRWEAAVAFGVVGGGEECGEVAFGIEVEAAAGEEAGPGEGGAEAGAAELVVAAAVGDAGDAAAGEDARGDGDALAVEVGEKLSHVAAGAGGGVEEALELLALGGAAGGLGDLVLAAAGAAEDGVRRLDLAQAVVDLDASLDGHEAADVEAVVDDAAEVVDGAGDDVEVLALGVVRVEIEDVGGVGVAEAGEDALGDAAPLGVGEALVVGEAKGDVADGALEGGAEGADGGELAGELARGGALHVAAEEAGAGLAGDVVEEAAEAAALEDFSDHGRRARIGKVYLGGGAGSASRSAGVDVSGAAAGSRPTSWRRRRRTSARRPARQGRRAGRMRPW